jgi:hypothetical protein
MEKSRLYAKLEILGSPKNRQEFDSFKAVHDFVRRFKEETEEEITEELKKKIHLRDLPQQLGKYFPEVGTDIVWIRNPFVNMAQIEENEINLPSKYIDTFVGLGSDGSPNSARKVSLVFGSIYGLNILQFRMQPINIQYIAVCNNL